MNLGSIGALGQLQQSGGLDLSSVETSYPRIKVPSVGVFKCVESKITFAKDDQAKPIWEIQLATTFPATSTEDKTLEVGHKVTQRVLLYTTDPDPVKKTNGRTTDMVLKDLSAALDGFFGEKFRRACDLNTLDVSVCKDQDATLKISVIPEKDGYPEQNGFRFVKKADPVA